jgi:16S rRNA (guanine966-N2)-methyltransferase
MRITGGRWRSRALDAPRGMATRPTSDRVREALFSMLVSDGLIGHDEDSESDGDGESDGAKGRVLDLYAGTGALAFEALSRGASAAVLVEHARDAVTAIRKNADALGVGRAMILFDTKVERALLKIEGPFAIVFLDPPYADVPTPAFAVVLARAAALLGPGGALVLEHASPDDPPDVPGLVRDRTRRYGDTSVTLYRAGQILGSST